MPSRTRGARVRLRRPAPVEPVPAMETSRSAS